MLLIIDFDLMVSSGRNVAWISGVSGRPETDITRFRWSYEKIGHCRESSSHTSDITRGTQQPNVSKYARSVLNSFLCTFEACLVNLELP